MRGQIEKTADAKRVIFQGNVCLSAKSTLSGKVLKFKVKLASKGSDKYPGQIPWFVNVQPWSKMEQEFTYEYIGTIWLDPVDLTLKYVHGKKSKFECDSNIGKATAKVINAILAEAKDPGFEIWHYGICARCGKKLTDPESIRTGLGPSCRKAIAENKPAKAVF